MFLHNFVCFSYITIIRFYTHFFYSNFFVFYSKSHLFSIFCISLISLNMICCMTVHDRNHTHLAWCSLSCLKLLKKITEVFGLWHILFIFTICNDRTMYTHYTFTACYKDEYYLQENTNRIIIIDLPLHSLLEKSAPKPP